jgi:hypothetical protein
LLNVSFQPPSRWTRHGGRLDYAVVLALIIASAGRRNLRGGWVPLMRLELGT